MNEQTRVWLRKRIGKKGATYSLRWICPQANCWRSRSVGSDSRKAERERCRLEDQLNAGSYRSMRRVKWAKFRDEHVGLIRGEVNKAEAKRTLKDFEDVCEPHAGPHVVTYSMIESYVQHLEHKGNATATINKRLRYLRAAFNKAIRRGYIAHSPLEGWKWSREDQKELRVLTDDEKAKLLDACPTDQWRTFVYVALTTGCRRGELLGLTWDRVDFANARMLITETKSRKDRWQPLNQPAAAMLRDLQMTTLADGGPFITLGQGNIANRFVTIVKAAGIGYCSIHDLRRTFCTDLARCGVNQLVAQKLAGHASSQTTARYYQVIDEDMKRQAIDRLSAGTA